MFLLSCFCWATSRRHPDPRPSQIRRPKRDFITHSLCASFLVSSSFIPGENTLDRRLATTAFLIFIVRHLYNRDKALAIQVENSGADGVEKEDTISSSAEDLATEDKK